MIGQRRSVSAFHLSCNTKTDGDTTMTTTLKTMFVALALLDLSAATAEAKSTLEKPIGIDRPIFSGVGLGSGR